MNNSRRQSMTFSNQPGKPRLSEQRLAADLDAFQQSGGAIERLGDTPLRQEKARHAGSSASNCSQTGRRSRRRVSGAAASRVLRLSLQLHKLQHNTRRVTAGIASHCAAP